jgi:hypothetical protein
MIILKETTDEQELFFIPRSYVFDKIVFKNETTKVVQEYNVSPLRVDQYGYAELVLDLKEQEFYQLKVYSGTDVVYYDKVFCTNQDVNDYSINDGVYITPNTNDDNEYATI